MTVLKAMAELHGSRDYDRLPAVPIKGSPDIVLKSAGWFMARIPGISGLIDMIK